MVHILGSLLGMLIVLSVYFGYLKLQSAIRSYKEYRNPEVFDGITDEEFKKTYDSDQAKHFRVEK